MAAQKDLGFHPFVTPNNVDRIVIPDFISVVEDKDRVITSEIQKTDYDNEEILKIIQNTSTKVETIRNIARQKGINSKLKKKELIDLIIKDINKS